MIGSSGIPAGHGLSGFLQRPIVVAIGMTTAMRGEKAAAMSPEQGPELFAVGLWQRQLLQRIGVKKFKPPFRLWRRQKRQGFFTSNKKMSQCALHSIPCR